MTRKKKLIDKKAKKRTEKQCYLCDNTNYATLHCHRILPGEEGGKYVDKNVVVVCANCHAKIHDGQIEIVGKHFSTAGRYVLNYFENDEEKWK